MPPLSAKIVFTVIIVALTIFFCTIGRWSLSSFYDSIFCSRHNLVANFIFTEDGEIRPIRLIIFYGIMLAMVWFA